MKLQRLLILGGLAMLAGCSTYTEVTNAVDVSNRTGRVELAAQQSAKLAQQHANDRDAVIYQLEAGTSERSLAIANLPPPVVAVAPAPATSQNAASPALGAAAKPPPPPPPSPSEGAYAKSVNFLTLADGKIDDYEEQAKRSVSAGVASAIVNPAMTPYRGMACDKIMCSTYLALDYLALDAPEKARATLNKAYRRQKDAVDAHATEIERNKEKIAAAGKGGIKDENGKSSGQGFDVAKANEAPQVKTAMGDISTTLDARMKAYEEYVNPFTCFVDGLFLLANATDGQERERAANEFLRVAAMEPDNSFLKQDAALASAAAEGQELQPATYVIFESGQAPHREELLIPVPLFLFSTSNAREMLTTQVPISRLVFNDQYNPALAVACGGGTYNTAVISNMDSVVAREFKNQMFTMWTDALICAATKAIIQHEVAKQLDKNAGETAAFLGKLVMAVATTATTRADTRTWRSLPKTFSYARFETPKDKQVTISTPDGMTKQVVLPEGAKTVVVYVKQVAPGTPLLVDSFKLN